MICKFHIGQRVVCVEDCSDECPPGAYSGIIFPVVGTRYVIRSVLALPMGVGVTLREIINCDYDFQEGRMEPLFWHKCFRPLDERDVDVSVFHEILDSVNSTPRVLEKMR